MPKPTTKVGKLMDGVKPKKERKEPLWKGPMDGSELGGITQGYINLFLSCRERFRLKVIEGLQTVDRFSPSIEYGQMWHICEEYHCRDADWQAPLKQYAQSLAVKYPLQVDEINKWYSVCKVQFPIYLAYYRKKRTKTAYQPLLQEQVFCVPYKLPSDRTVYLKGKWDSIDISRDHHGVRYIWLQENKTKSEIDTEKINRQLKFDLQTMLYLIAMEQSEIEYGKEKINLKAFPVKGVRYNVIRRPLAGGKGSIRPHQAKGNKPAETSIEFYERLNGVILEDVDTYFYRVDVEVFQSDMKRFRQLCLDPVLEQICNWYEYITDPDPSKSNEVHYASPFGLYNPLVETGQTDLDAYFETGSEVGLERIDSLFPELK